MNQLVACVYTSDMALLYAMVLALRDVISTRQDPTVFNAQLERRCAIRDGVEQICGLPLNDYPAGPKVKAALKIAVEMIKDRYGNDEAALIRDVNTKLASIDFPIRAF